MKILCCFLILIGSFIGSDQSSQKVTKEKIFGIELGGHISSLPDGFELKLLKAEYLDSPSVANHLEIVGYKPEGVPSEISSITVSIYKNRVCAISINFNKSTERELLHQIFEKVIVKRKPLSMDSDVLIEGFKKRDFQSYKSKIDEVIVKVQFKNREKEKVIHYIHMDLFNIISQQRRAQFDKDQQRKDEISKDKSDRITDHL